VKPLGARVGNYNEGGFSRLSGIVELHPRCHYTEEPGKGLGKIKKCYTGSEILLDNIQR